MESELFSVSPALAWFVAGVFFMALEALTPGFFLLFFGLGAWAAAVCGWAGSLGLVGQFLVFLVVTVAGLAGFRRKLRFFLTARSGRSEEMDDPVAAEQYLGRSALVVHETAPGRPGLVELNGTNWNARSEAGTFKPGERVRVRAREGLTLVVEKFPAPGEAPAQAEESE